eukprot:2542799-Prymnesium_polylepis.2
MTRAPQLSHVTPPHAGELSGGELLLLRGANLPHGVEVIRCHIRALRRLTWGGYHMRDACHIR